MIITISGIPGAGKTSTGRYLADKLGYKFYSMGDLQGNVAGEMGITIDELMRRAKTDPSIHKRVDEYQARLARIENDFVCDGWLSFRWMPDSYKILLTAAPGICAFRVFEEQKRSGSRPDEKRYETLDEVLSEQKDRFEAVRQTFIEQYGVDMMDGNHYDLCLNTSHLSVEGAADKILKSMNIVRV